MNVLIVSEPAIDGVFRYVETLSRFLVERGVRVHLAYSDRRAGARLGRLLEVVAGHGGATLNLRVANRPSGADVAAFRSLRALAKEVQPDVIHSHSSKAGVLARGLAWAGVPAAQVYQPHAYVGMRPKAGPFDRWYVMVERMLGRIAHTIACSSGERRFAVDRLHVPADRLHQIPNGVDGEVFRPAGAEEKRRLRGEFGLPATGPVLGFVGRSAAQKDPETLYRAFARALAEAPDVTLFHVGRGELDATLAQMARTLGITGRIVRVLETREPAEAYQAMDGFILTSHYEGFSLAVLEALASDVPLILSDVAGNHDLLQQPLSHGWSVAPGDVEGFARAIVGWRRDLGQRLCNHRGIARERYRLETQLGAVLELYTEIGRRV